MTSAFIDSMNFTPIFGQVSPQQHGSSFNPFGNSEIGKILSQLVNAEISKRFGGAGYFMGAFNPSQNFFDQYQAQQFSTAQSRAMKVGMAQDSQTLQNLMGNLYSIVTGNKVTPGQSGLISKITETAMENFFPSLAAMMPGTIDQMFGLKGSTSLFNMGLAQGMRHAMGPDGKFGGFATPENATALGEAGKKLFAELTARPTDLHGVGGAAAGQMFSQMTQRGLIGEKDLLTAQGKFNTEGTKTKLKEMSNAVAAMRDVFGDMGKADAPMVEIMNGLEALTQGGLGKFDAARVAKIVRETHHISKMAGIGMDAVMGMQSSVTSQLASIGMDSSFANPIVQESMAFATAYGSTFGGAGGWRKANKEQMMALDQKLRVGAAGSQVFNQASAILRLGDLGVIKEGSKAWELYQQLKSGDSSKLSHMSSGDFINFLVKQGGVDQQAASNALFNQDANAEFGQKYNVAGMVRSEQARLQLTPRLRQQIGGAARTALGNTAAADKIAEVVSKDIFSKLDRDTLADPVKRQKAIIDMMVQAVGGQDAADKIGMDKIKGLAATVWGNLESTYGSDYGGAINFITSHNPENLKKQQALLTQSRRDAALAGVMSGFGISGPFRRIFDAMAEKDADVKSIAAKFFGGSEKAEKALGENKEKILKAMDLEKKITNLQSQLNQLDPADPKTKEMRDKIQKEIDQNTGDLSKIMFGDGKEEKGLSDTFRDLGLNLSAVKKIQEKTMSDAIKDMRGKDSLKENADKLGTMREKIEKKVKDEAKESGEKLTDAELAERIKKAEQDWLKNPDSEEYKEAEKIFGKEKIKELADKNISLGDLGDYMKGAAESEEAKKMYISGNLTINKPGEGNMVATGVPDIGGGKGAPPPNKNTKTGVA